MTICIESLSVENFRLFCSKHTLDLSQAEETTISVVTGPNGSGKTTLVDSIRLCLAGDFSDVRPLVSLKLIDELSPGEETSGRVSLVISSTDLSRKFRFTRTFRTSVTRRGPVNSVDPLQAEEEIDNEWVDVNSSRVMNTVFPLPAFTFCNIDAESYLGLYPTDGSSWSELVKDVGKAAAQQSLAHGVDLPEHCWNNDDLEDEMVSRINGILTNIDFRYRVEKRENGLVGVTLGTESDGKAVGLPAGERTIISQVVALVTASILPESPPLVGDSVFGRTGFPHRKVQSSIYQKTERQVLLVVTEIELEDLDINPSFRLDFNEEDLSSAIIATD